jgi:hypothetical protein
MPGCLSDLGYGQGESIRGKAVALAANIRRVAAIAIAIDNAMRLVQNYQDQHDIAQRSTDISKAQQNQIATVFWPREADFLAEFSTPEPIEAVEVMGRRYGGRLASTVAKQFADALKEAKCSFSRYCTSANSKLLQDLMMTRSLAIANARVLGRNIAFAEFQARTDVNYNRRLQAVSLGRGLINEAMTLYRAAGQGLAGVGDQLSKQFNSALEAFGYAGARSAADAGMFAQSAFNTASKTQAPVSGVDAQSYMQTVNKFGFEHSQSDFSSYDKVGAPFNDSRNSDVLQSGPVSQELPINAEHHRRGDVGNDNLVPQGMMTFAVVDDTVTVDLGMYMLGYVDDKSPGDLNSSI